jgi:protein gp37
VGETTSISWTDSSFNGWIGCTVVGPPCFGCYARDLDARYQWGVPAAERIKGAAPHWGPGAPRYRTSAANWRKPLAWNEEAKARGIPRKVFAHSLSDVFDNEVPAEWRDDLFDLMRRTPWLRWQVLTKRVPNIARMLPSDWGDGYPNVGLVASCGTQAEFDRDEERLLPIPARWHGFSLEPQLERIVIGGRSRTLHYDGSVWIITGGESRQAGAKLPDGTPLAPRPWYPAWARDLIDASRLAPHVSVFVKQTGAAPVGLEPPADGAGADPTRWPANIRHQTFVPELLS